MSRRILVVTTATMAEAEVDDIVREHAGADAEIEVVAPASKISRLDRWTNAEDDAREDASARAEAVSDAISNGETDGHVGDVDPLQAIEDALRMFPADEIVLVTAPDDGASWLESGLGEKVHERFALPVTRLVTR